MDRSLLPLMVPRETLRPPSADSTGTGALVSLIAHGALVGALALGVQWRTEEPTGVEAELWAAVPELAAPPAATPEELPPPVVEQPPELAPPPVVAPPPPQAEAPDAEIALEREQKRKAQERKEAEDQRAREKRQQAERDRKEAAAKAEREAEREAEKRKQETEAQRKQQDKLAKAEQQKREKQEAARLDAQRQANLRRMTEQAGGNGSPESTGTAARSAGPSANYAGRIKGYIKPNIVLTDAVSGNPTAEVEVRVTPDGTIIARRLTQPSGSREWDEAVLRAIDRTAKLPRDTDGRIPPTIVITFRPAE